MPLRDRPFSRLPFAILVTVAVVLLACGDAPPVIDAAVAPGPAVRPEAAAPAAPPPASAGAQAGPQAIAFDPPLDATGVDPGRTTLSVTFDRAMDPEGWAWVTESPETTPQIARSSWNDAVRVNTAEVDLAPGRTYVLWINSPQYLYFKDTLGRPLPPVRWSFSTAPAAAPAPAPIDAVSSH